MYTHTHKQIKIKIKCSYTHTFITQSRMPVMQTKCLFLFIVDFRYNK